MKILVLSDSFKETATSLQVVSTIREGVQKVYSSYEVDAYPFSDGGEGSEEALLSLLPNGEKKTIVCKDPSNNIEMEATYLVFPEFVFVESAQANGLEKTVKKNPLYTSTYGLGILLKEALKEKPKKILISLGGSATDDLGAGMLEALGASFSDERGERITSPIQGKDLVRIKDVDFSSFDKGFKEKEFLLLSDVKNPLLGKEGATYTFAPQKGAREEDLPLLESGKENLASLLTKKTGRDVSLIPGSGAAGGLGGAFLFTAKKVEITSGGKWMLSLFTSKHPFSSYDLIITGEGKIDQTTLKGKCVYDVAQEAKKNHIPCLAIGGYVEKEVIPELEKIGVSDVLSVQKEKRSIEELKKTACEDLKKAVVKYFSKKGERRG